MPVRLAASRVAPAIAGDDSDRQIQAFQHRPLLDVEFEVGKQFGAGPCSRSDMVGV